MARSDHLCSVLIGALLVGSAQAKEPQQDSPHDWLDRMSHAVRELNYEGRFVVQSADSLDALYLVHRVDNGIEKERMVSLTGKPREVIRSDQAVACLMPGRDRHINIGRRPSDQSISPLNTVSSEELSRSYKIELADEAFVAGRQTQQILIEPRDGLRYGYRLYLDEQTALPLRSVVLDDSNQPISQLMFVEIRVGEGITPIELDIAAMQIASVAPRQEPTDHQALKPSWRLSELPAGFRLSGQRTRPGGGDGDLQHAIYSDGLATFSVYVQPASEQGLSGESQLGSAKAVGRVADGHEIVVVGEVPMRTLRWVAERVVPVAQ
jgi:sigma-E factor negative regulatory protein RseB